MALFGYPLAREKQCRACGASGARCLRALVELNRENSGTPLSHVLAIADDVPAKFEIEFDPYVLGIEGKSANWCHWARGARGGTPCQCGAAHRLKGRGCQMQLPRAT